MLSPGTYQTSVHDVYKQSRVRATVAESNLTVQPRHIVVPYICRSSAVYASGDEWRLTTFAGNTIASDMDAWALFFLTVSHRQRHDDPLKVPGGACGNLPCELMAFRRVLTPTSMLPSMECLPATKDHYIWYHLSGSSRAQNVTRRYIKS